MLFTSKNRASSGSLDQNEKKSAKTAVHAQSMLEYMIILGVVTVVLVALGPLFKRGIQAVVRLVADQFQTQANAEQKVTPTSGYLIDQYSSASAQTSKYRTELQGDVLFNYDTQENATTTSSANLGFTNRYN